jgi:hypothetical protein
MVNERLVSVAEFGIPVVLKRGRFDVMRREPREGGVPSGVGKKGSQKLRIETGSGRSVESTAVSI